MSPLKGQAKAFWVVCFAVLFATAPWLAGSAVAEGVSAKWQLGPSQKALLGTLTQAGFISGTLIYAMAGWADRYSARMVFVVSALLGAAFNAGFAFAPGYVPALAFRFFTGITLAGVYPVGMKIIASWFSTGLGYRLGVMVGALTAGTSLPFLLKAGQWGLSWRGVVLGASAAAAVAALAVLALVRDGPLLPRAAKFEPAMMWKVFAHRRFRRVALGYFGHMWELYAFWALGGYYLSAALGESPLAVRVPLIAFLVIAVGALGCALGGLISRRFGELGVARAALLGSALCCGLSPLVAGAAPALVVVFALAWGVLVVADSPQFSALASQNCPPEHTGTALTVQNGVGFLVSIVSMQLAPLLAETLGWAAVFAVLAPGPLLGLLALRGLEEPPRARISA
jgi:MFS family permease